MDEGEGQEKTLPIIFKWINGITEISIELEAFRPIIFIGFNNTLKSITARVICASLYRSRLITSTIPERNWEVYLDKIITLSNGVYPSIELADEVREKIKDMLGIIIEDSRVSMRKYLEIEGSLSDEIEGFRKTIKRYVESTHVNDVLQRFDNIIDIILYNITLNIAYVYQQLKSQASLMKFVEYGNILKSIIREVLNEFKEIKSDEIFEENLLPLDVEVVFQKQPLVKVKDLRTGESIPVGTVSTSISSMLLFKLFTLAMSIEVPKLIIIEEPEYALAPLQQIIFTRLIENSLIKSRDHGDPPTYVILITHSPYIAVGFENPKVYYFRYAQSLRKFISEEAWPAKQFALATSLLFKISRETP